jgi:hypothetical protein
MCSALNPRGVRKLGQAIFPSLPLFLAVPRRRERLAVKGERSESRSDGDEGAALYGETRRLTMHANSCAISTQGTPAIPNPRNVLNPGTPGDASPPAKSRQ